MFFFETQCIVLFPYNFNVLGQCSYMQQRDVLTHVVQLLGALAPFWPDASNSYRSQWKLNCGLPCEGLSPVQLFAMLFFNNVLKYFTTICYKVDTSSSCFDNIDICSAKFELLTS